MNPNSDRKKLVEMIYQIQSSQVIGHLKEAVEDLLEAKNGFELTETHRNILDYRIDKYRNGDERLYSWDEVLAFVHG